MLQNLTNAQLLYAVDTLPHSSVLKNSTVNSLPLSRINDVKLANCALAAWLCEQLINQSAVKNSAVPFL